MKIKINNLGPIQHASFDFDKKLSIFCGPNNTGKTYLSYVLYAFTRQQIDAFEESMTETQLNDFLIKRSFILPVNPEAIYEAISKRQDRSMGDMATVFGISDSVAQKLFADFKMCLTTDKESYVAYLKNRELDFKISYKGNLLAKVTKKSGELELLVENVSSQIDNKPESLKNELLTQVYKVLAFPVFFSHFFPVERNSLYTYYKDIMVNRSQMMEFLQRLENGNRQAFLDYISRNSARYPEAISYTLDAAYKMSALSQDKGYYASLADDIEQEILEGKLSLTDDGDLKYTPNRVPDKEVPLYLSASITKSVSGLVYALRHVVGRYDMIFIDEPEVNCHPDAQILMARIFGKMVNAGIRLLISTHSDYIIREINNLIMLSAAPKEMTKQLQEWGYKEDMALRPQVVGAYLFKYGNGENRVDVTPIEVNDSGFEVKTIDESISKQNEISETLYYELKYGNDKQS